jgi:hypothetical protein
MANFPRQPIDFSRYALRTNRARARARARAQRSGARARARARNRSCSSHLCVRLGNTIDRISTSSHSRPNDRFVIDARSDYEHEHRRSATEHEHDV